MPWQWEGKAKAVSLKLSPAAAVPPWCPAGPLEAEVAKMAEAEAADNAAAASAAEEAAGLEEAVTDPPSGPPWGRVPSMSWRGREC